MYTGIIIKIQNAETRMIVIKTFCKSFYIDVSYWIDISYTSEETIKSSFTIFSELFTTIHYGVPRPIFLEYLKR